MLIKKVFKVLGAEMNSWIDRNVDPIVMADQTMRDFETDKGKLRYQTAVVVADQKKAERELSECDKEIENMEAYAEKAVRAGNDDDAREFLREKANLEEKRLVLLETKNVATRNSERMKGTYNKVSEEINEFGHRRDMMKAKANLAETQKTVNSLTTRLSDSSYADAFACYEKRVNSTLDISEAEYQIIEEMPDSKMDDLVRKYGKVSDSDIEAELAAIKRRIGVSA